MQAFERIETELLGDDLTATCSATHSAARAETEPRATGDVVDGARHFVHDDVTNFGFDDRLAGADDGALARFFDETLHNFFRA